MFYNNKVYQQFARSSRPLELRQSRHRRTWHPIQVESKRQKTVKARCQPQNGGTTSTGKEGEAPWHILKTLIVPHIFCSKQPKCRRGTNTSPPPATRFFVLLWKVEGASKREYAKNLGADSVFRPVFGLLSFSFSISCTANSIDP